MSSAKRSLAMVEEEEEEEEEGCGRLLPGLPDDIALLCLARLPRRVHPFARCVSRAWKEAMDHPASLRHIRRTAGISSEAWVFFCVSSDSPVLCRDIYQGFLIDPASLRCDPVAPPPFPSSPSPASCEGIYLQALSAGACVFFTATTISTASHLVCCFDSLHRQWLPPQPLPSMLVKRRSFASASTFLHGDGYVYAAGGHLGHANRYRALKTAERLEVKYNRGMGEWKELPDMHMARSGAAAVVLQDMFSVIGGFHSSAPSGNPSVHYSGEYWDPSTGEWVLINELWPEEVFGLEKWPVVTVLAGRLCALRQVSRDLMAYEPATKGWTSIGTFPTQRCHPDWEYTFSLLGVGEELWVIGEATVNHADVFVQACTPFGGKPLIWRLLPFSFDSSFLITAITTEV